MKALLLLIFFFLLASCDFEKPPKLASNQVAYIFTFGNTGQKIDPDEFGAYFHGLPGEFVSKTYSKGSTGGLFDLTYVVEFEEVPSREAIEEGAREALEASRKEFKFEVEIQRGDENL